MIQIGRLCLKTNGRDAGLRCVILTDTKNNRVLIDGETRRRLCNVNHLEPLPTVVSVAKEASHQDVAAVLSHLGITVLATKPKKAIARPRKLRRSKLAVTSSASEKTSEKKAVTKTKETPVGETVLPK